jgi:hypothetical protein
MLRTERLGFRLAVLLACTMLVGCDALGNIIPGLSSYKSAPSGGKTTLLTFETPSMPFENAAKGEAGGFAAGSWAVVDGKLQQTVGATDNLANHLKYTGDAFGDPGGRAGLAYRVSVDCSVAKDADSPAVHGYPVGVLAMMPYYKDPTHYVMLVADKQNLSCWVVNGQRPAGNEWPAENRIWDEWLSEPLAASASVRWGADVDVDAHSLTIYVNDQKKATRTVPMINRDSHWIALGANGNYAQFDNFKIVWTK